ncbi:MAG: metallopeptidase family protein [Phycisphaerales bacterium JB059]
MTDEERAAFDALVDEVIADLPERVVAVFDEAPLLVDDEPAPGVLREFGLDPSNEEDRASLCGLHTGVAITERSVEMDGVLPSQIHIYRRGIVREAGGWAHPEEVREQIRITILHEVGHEMGLDEEDLEDLGYA